MRSAARDAVEFLLPQMWMARRAMARLTSPAAMLDEVPLMRYRVINTTRTTWSSGHALNIEWPPPRHAAAVARYAPFTAAFHARLSAIAAIFRHYCSLTLLYAAAATLPMMPGGAYAAAADYSMMLFMLRKEPLYVEAR